MKGHWKAMAILAIILLLVLGLPKTRAAQPTTYEGEPVKLARPLDFLVVSDHSDALGAMNEIVEGNPNLLIDPSLRDWHNRINQGGETVPMTTMEVIQKFTEGTIPEVLESKKSSRSIWNEYLEIAERYNESGRLTALIGAPWKWEQTLYSNDTKALPSNPERYTLKLLADGRVSILADCNVGGGVYTLRGSELSIEITHTTMAACPPGSMERIYIQDLNAAAIYFMEGDILYIDLKYDSGTMKFSR